MTQRIICAIPKGESEPALDLLPRSGADVPPGLDESRAYRIDADVLTFLMVKPQDVAKLVEYGAADIGIAGKQHLIEANTQTIELIDLGTNLSRFRLLGTAGTLSKPIVRIATPYPNAALTYMSGETFDACIVRLSGNLEAALMLGMCDAAFDVSGESASSESDLHVLRVFAEVSDRLIANRCSYVHRFDRIDSLRHLLSEALQRT